MYPTARPGARADEDYEGNNFERRPWTEDGSNEDRRRKKACTGKIKYVRREYADQAIAEIRARESLYTHPLNSYRCSFCGYWHTGHVPSVHPAHRKPGWKTTRTIPLAELEALRAELLKISVPL